MEGIQRAFIDQNGTEMQKWICRRYCEDIKTEDIKTAGIRREMGHMTSESFQKSPLESALC